VTGAFTNIAYLATLWRGDLPIWVLMTIVMLPFGLFVLAEPDRLPARIVWIAHVFASISYIATVLVIGWGLSVRLPAGWSIYPLPAAIGVIPCGIVLYRVVQGTYRPNERQSEWDTDW
jgi:hypothetical protein